MFVLFYIGIVAGQCSVCNQHICLDTSMYACNTFHSVILDGCFNAASLVTQLSYGQVDRAGMDINGGSNTAEVTAVSEPDAYDCVCTIYDTFDLSYPSIGVVTFTQASSSASGTSSCSAMSCSETQTRSFNMYWANGQNTDSFKQIFLQPTTAASFTVVNTNTATCSSPAGGGGISGGGIGGGGIAGIVIGSLVGVCGLGFCLRFLYNSRRSDTQHLTELTLPGIKGPEDGTEQSPATGI